MGTESELKITHPALDQANKNGYVAHFLVQWCYFYSLMIKFVLPYLMEICVGVMPPKADALSEPKLDASSATPMTDQVFNTSSRFDFLTTENCRASSSRIAGALFESLKYLWYE